MNLIITSQASRNTIESLSMPPKNAEFALQKFSSYAIWQSFKYVLSISISIFSYLFSLYFITGQGNIFTSVCQEFCSQGGVSGLVPAEVSNFSDGGFLQIFGGGGSSKYSGGPPIFGGGGSPPEYVQRSAGTHPTGMHSYLKYKLSKGNGVF